MELRLCDGGALYGDSLVSWKIESHSQTVSLISMSAESIGSTSMSRCFGYTVLQGNRGDDPKVW